MKTTQPLPQRRARRAGFSTADVLAGLGLSMIALGAIYAFGKAQTKALAAQSVYNESQAVTRSVMDLITRELRMTSYDPTGNPGAIPNAPPLSSCAGVDRAIVEATPTKIHFQQDLNGDGLIGGLTGAGEDITYDVLGDKLRRTDGTSLPEDLVGGVTSFTLQYFNGSKPPVELIPSGSPPALNQGQRDCTAKVRITVRARITDTSNANNYGLTSLAESEVAIRNRSLPNF